MTAIGRPTRFEPEMCEQAHNYCLLGATNDELAEFFDVSPSTIDRWIAERADFRDAVRSGRVAADARVARGLYARAIGYDRTFERSVVIGSEVKPVTSTDPLSAQRPGLHLLAAQPPPPDLARRDPTIRPSDTVDDIALLDAAGESMRHHDGD